MRSRPVHNRRSPGGAGHGSYRAGFSFGILSFLTVVAVGLVSAVATARIYGVRIIGEFALVSAPVAALWVLSTAKEQAALIREITSLPPRHPRVAELFAAVITFSSLLTLAMSVVGGVACTFVFRGPLHHPELVRPMLASLAGYVVVTNTGWNIDAVFSAFVAGRQLFWIRLHETLSFFVAAIAVGLAWHSVWGLIVATIAGSLTALVHRVVVARRFVSVRLDEGGYRRGMQALPGLLRFGLKITPGGIAQGISQQAGVWAVASVAPTALIGAYSRALTIPERLQQVNFRIAEVLYPTLVGRRARGDGEGFDRALLDTVRYALMGMLLIASVCGGAAHAILALFGPGFSRAASAFALLIIYPALAVIASAQNQALFALERPGLTSVVALGRVAVTLALTVVLTPRVGISGPAIALLAGFVIDVTWKSVVLISFLSRPLRESWPLGHRIALAVAYPVGFSSAHLLEHSSAAWLLPSLLLGTLAYLAVLLLGGAINGRDRDRLAEVLAGARRWQAERRALEPAAT